MASVKHLTRYPIKGLSGQGLERVALHPGQGFPMDRVFGFARYDSGFDSADPQPMPKSKFLVLARDATLAQLDTRYDDANKTLSIKVAQQDHEFDLSTDQGQQAASAFLCAHLQMPSDTAPNFVTSEPHRFTDVSVISPQLMNAISIINLDSVSAFSDKIGQDVDAKRFRGNIVISGLAPFSELEMEGREIEIGQVRVKIVKRTKRCAATEVNLKTGARDLKVPALLHQHHGHFDMGVYAEVLQGGQIAVDDAVTVPN